MDKTKIERLENKIRQFYKLHPHETEILVSLLIRNVQNIPKYVSRSLQNADWENVKWAGKSLNAIGVNLELSELQEAGEKLYQHAEEKDIENTRRVIKNVKALW